MKLIDLVCEQPASDDKLLNGLKALTQSFENQENANIIVNGILHRLPSARYTGTMYRIIFIKSSDIAKCQSNKDVIALVKRYDASVSKKFWSFSKSIDQFKQYLEMQPPPDDGVTPEDTDVAVILQQHNTGLDVGAVVRAWGNHVEWWDRIHSAANVGEVLATVDQSIKPVMYIVRGFTGKGRMIGGERIHTAKNYRFRTSSFDQMITMVRTMSSGDPTPIKRPTIHPKSQMRDVQLP